MKITPANDRQIEMMKEFWKDTPTNPPMRQLNAALLKKDFLSLIARLERAAPASAAEPEVKIMPRGGVERNWWEEYQLLLRQFKKLGKAARQCVEEVDANLAKDDWPVKYRAPFEGLTKLCEALPETYEEHKARNAITIDTR